MGTFDAAVQADDEQILVKSSALVDGIAVEVTAILWAALTL